MSERLILVSGATGYIASQIIPRLLERNLRVRVLARHPRRLDKRSWVSKVEILPGDVMKPDSLIAALRGVHTAYYLIHNMSIGQGYTVRELEGASNFAHAAKEAGVSHIIYLSGLADSEQTIAAHLRSRIETGAALRLGGVPVTEFRAGVIVGTGSTSFEMIRFMTELCPLIPGPAWLRNKSQPIAVQNVVDYLLAAIDHRECRGQVFEIGGPEVTTYGELMLRYGRLRGHKRRLLLLPYIPVWFMALGIELMTPVPRRIAYALVGGLSSDSFVLSSKARQVFPEVKLMDFETAAKQVLTDLHPAKVERAWEAGPRTTRFLKHAGFFILQRESQTDALTERAFSAIRQTVNRMGGEVEADEPPQHLLIHRERGRIGDGWLEWRLKPEQDGMRLTQTIFFAPRGLGGFLYWFLLYAWHVWNFNKVMRAILRNSQTS